MRLFIQSKRFVYILWVAALAACATSDPRRIPAPLSDIKPTLNVRQIWKAEIGRTSGYAFQPVAFNSAVYAAAEDGTVVKLDAASGATIWRAKLGTGLSAGVGSDGALTAAGGAHGIVYLLDDNGKQLWQAQVKSDIATPPLVGQGLVLVRTIDGCITAFDAQTGKQKWTFRSRSAALNLRTTVGMTFAGPGAVLAGFPGGALAAINLASGAAYWQTPVSYPSGVTEVERINDVTGAPALMDSTVCAVTFQGRIGCFELQTGQRIWEHPFSSYGGLAHDALVLACADDWSVLSLYDAADGRRQWQNAQLKNRALSTPAIFGQTVAVGDYQGFIHFLSRSQGEFVARVATDGGAITAQPLQAGRALIVQTQKGHLYAFQAE